MENIIKYLKKEYCAKSIIIYGSYAKGTYGPTSDFDALVLTEQKPSSHDGSNINEIELDVFVYNLNDFNLEELIPRIVNICDGIVIYDNDDLGAEVLNKVKKYVEELPSKSVEEKRHLIEWCKKMLQRYKKKDIDGLYRGYWLLVDSLEIYHNINDVYYAGPNKALKYLKENDKEGYKIYVKALENFNYENLKTWIRYIDLKY